MCFNGSVTFFLPWVYILLCSCFSESILATLRKDISKRTSNIRSSRPCVFIMNTFVRLSVVNKKDLESVTRPSGKKESINRRVKNVEGALEDGTFCSELKNTRSGHYNTRPRPKNRPESSLSSFNSDNTAADWWTSFLRYPTMVK